MRFAQRKEDRHARFSAQVMLLQGFREQTEIGMAAITVSLQLTEPQGNIPLQCLCAVGECKCIIPPGPLEITQLYFQHAGIGMDARVRRACASFSFTDGSGITFAIAVVEQLHGLDRGGNILWLMIKKCAYGSGSRLQSCRVRTATCPYPSGGASATEPALG